MICGYGMRCRCLSACSCCIEPRCAEQQPAGERPRSEAFTMVLISNSLYHAGDPATGRLPCVCSASFADVKHQSHICIKTFDKPLNSLLNAVKYLSWVRSSAVADAVFRCSFWRAQPRERRTSPMSDSQVCPARRRNRLPNDSPETSGFAAGGTLLLSGARRAMA